MVASRQSLPACLVNPPVVMVSLFPADLPQNPLWGQKFLSLIFKSFQAILDDTKGIVGVIDGEAALISQPVNLPPKDPYTGAVEGARPISWASSPSIEASRDFNSPAALLVKVMARIFQGRTGRWARMAERASRSDSFRQ